MAPPITALCMFATDPKTGERRSARVTDCMTPVGYLTEGKSKHTRICV
jgi:hypothetical protein